MSTKDVCPICLEYCTDKLTKSVTRCCNHEIHTACANLITTDNCPLCRRKMGINLIREPTQTAYENMNIEQLQEEMHRLLREMHVDDPTPTQVRNIMHHMHFANQRLIELYHIREENSGFLGFCRRVRSRIYSWF